MDYMREIIIRKGNFQSLHDEVEPTHIFLSKSIYEFLKHQYSPLKYTVLEYAAGMKIILVDEHGIIEPARVFKIKEDE